MSRTRRRFVRTCLVLMAAMLLPAGGGTRAGTLQKTSDLSFGQVIVGGAGSVTVSPGGGRSAAGGAMLGSGLTASAASFVVTGPAMTAYGIVLPASVTLESGGASATVDTFTSDPTDSGVLDANGSQTLRVGATLHVSASQASGTYAGAFPVTVTYN